MQTYAGITKTCTQLLCALLFLFSSNSSFAEGTAQLAPSNTDTISLNINNVNYYSFAKYGSADSERFYVHIEDPENEQVYLGFAEPYGPDGHYLNDKVTAFFRIMDPDGNMVYGPQRLDGSTANISSHAQCVAGPSNIAGASGYSPFVFDPSGLASGDYYIEFNADSLTYSADQFMIPYFDVTVATTDASPAAIDGRVYAKNWAFFLPSIDKPSATYGWFDRPFNGRLFVYTDDGFVSDINFNNSGFQPAAFNISVNTSGTKTSASLIDDRKSLNDGQGNTVEYRIFLNDPDIIAYPSGTFGELFTDSTQLVGCVETGLYFKIVTSQQGVIELLLDQDQASGAGIYDPGTADRILMIDIKDQITDDTPDLYTRYIPWDGLDGLGNSVSVINPVTTEIAYSQGRFHIPVYDAEYNLNGFSSTVIRPTPPPAYILNYYYDDSNIPDNSNIAGQAQYEFEGCTPACHRWDNRDYGNLNTINTWWYAKQEFQTGGLSLVEDCGADSDNDGIYDAVDIDWDNDGIPNYLEACTQPSSTTITVQVDIKLDQYPGETTWDIVDASSTVVASGGGYPGQPYELVSDTIVLPIGSYTFNIYDGYGDGICCSQGLGYFQLIINQSTVIGGNGNGNYGDGTSEAFTADADYYGCVEFDPTIDSDNDGILNYQDDDFCTLNAYGVCELLDPDNDGVPNFLDLDSDDDGMPDIIEAGGTDSNNDGYVDYPTPSDPTTMNDSDNDGLADEYDPDNTGAIDNPDTDGDNVYDAYDLDSDNDGLADLVEVGGVDTDGNGMVDEMTDPSTGDTNNNGWGDTTEGAVLVDQELATDTDIDFDEDTFPNHLDIDSDNDGINDVIESGGQDGNGDGMADDNSGTITDTNGDGWDDNYDDGVLATTADGADANTIADFETGTDNPDFDADGLPNWLDIDADDDGLVDNSEGQATDSYVAPTTDSDNDGLNDAYEDASTIGTFGGVGIDPVNIDGVADGDDYLDLDTDNDLEPDNIEGHDTDGDGDVDGSDTPAALTGIFIGTDSDLDGLDDGYDNNIGSIEATDGGLTPSSYVDFDDLATTERDWRETSDIDLDDDGILNDDEDGGVGFNPVSDADNDGIPNFLDDDDATAGFPAFVDANLDGINDVYDHDMDGIPDYIDLDADNDGIPDLVEAGGIDTNGDGRVDDLTDTDGDGLMDDYDSNCTNPSCSPSTTGTDIPNQDMDGDGLNDYIDLDADNDGIPDLVEAGGIDTDGEGRVDENTDLDNDGLADIYDENATDGSGVGGTNGTALVDTDPTGIWQDGETNEPIDTDSDGFVDGLDLDADNDGIPDIIEAGGADDDGDGGVDTQALPWDADNDGLADIYDESASDGPGGAGADGVALVETTADTNNDGHVNAAGENMAPGNDNVINADNDEIPNHLDIDADNDGIVDIIEAGGNDSNGDGLVDDFDPGNPTAFDTSDEDGWSPTYDGDAANDGPITTVGDGSPMIDTEDSNFDGTPESYTLGDSDADNHPNFLDIDADDDGIVDNVEGQDTPGYTLPDENDGDGDGLDDAYDNYVGFGGTGIESDAGDLEGTPYDHDSDNIPDYLDWDTDGDNIPDVQEAWDNLLDGDSKVDPSIGVCDGSDVDKDGLLDCFDSDTSSPVVTDYKTPIDDNGFNGGATTASTPTSGNDPSEIFPDNSGGDGQADWRDVLIDCGTPKVFYAISEQSITTDTDYEFNGTEHVDEADTKVVRATAFCEPDADGWYYFFNPLEPENYLFALRNTAGSPNVIPVHELVDFIEIKVETDPTNRHMVSDTEANFVMERDWRVEFKGTPSPGSTFDIKFYFRPEEMNALKAAADAVEENASQDVTRSFYWFKRPDGLENENITSSTIENMTDVTNDDPNDIDDTNTGLMDSTTPGNNKNYVIFEGLSSFSGGTAGINLMYSSLPVELTRFTGKVENCNAVLDWMSATEENFSHYEIERSNNGIVFEQIARINGQGGLNAYAYRFTDNEAGKENYYRLKMVDTDGSFKYSDVEIVIVDCGDTNFKVYPNPIRNEQNIFIEFGEVQQEVTVSVFDQSGRLIKDYYHNPNNGSKASLSVADLPAGTYLISFQYAGKREAIKFVKVK